jgi:hypothetical protein
MSNPNSRSICLKGNNYFFFFFYFYVFSCNDLKKFHIYTFHHKIKKFLKNSKMLNYYNDQKTTLLK